MLIADRVRAIPRGSVRTYGDIDARAPRLVGHVLATMHDLPWHRVVRADGTIPRGEPQRELLEAEGVPMRGDRVDVHAARLPPCKIGTFTYQGVDTSSAASALA
jgi:alkylated DNA nucleotide flippase Atl1